MKVLDKGSVTLLNHMGDDNTVVSAARVSFLGESKGEEQDTKLIRYLLKNKHTSPFEQVEFQFLVKCPLFIARQWHRHRTWSYNEVSRRYTSEELDFHVPDTLRKQASKNRQMSEGVIEYNVNGIEIIDRVNKMLYNLYQELLNEGVCREQARMILPLTSYTSFYAKVDLHNLFHFLELRNHPHAQWEIRQYASAIEILIAPIVPICYNAWRDRQEEK